MRMAAGHKGHHYHQTKCGLSEAQTEKPQAEYTCHVSSVSHKRNKTRRTSDGTSTLCDVTTTSAKAITRAESDQTGNEPRSPYQQKDARPINTRSQGPIRNGRRTDGKASYYPAHGQNGQKMYNESHCFTTSTILETCRVSTIDSITTPKAYRVATSYPIDTQAPHKAPST